MSQAARLFHICRRLADGATVTAASLQDELEVARATVFRDIAVLRDQLLAPIVWDIEAETFRFDQPGGAHGRFMVPGLWMDARQLYGMLTMINIADAVDPGLAQPFHREFRRLLKQLMSEYDVPGYRLDKKIVVGIEPLGTAGEAAMQVIGPALMLDQPVRLHGLDDEGPAGKVVMPRRLRLMPDGWWLDWSAEADAAEHSVAVRQLTHAEAVPGEDGTTEARS